MLNINKQKIEFQCPECHFYNETSIRQVILRNIIICRGCKCSIQLEDYMNECRKLEKTINTVIDKLKRTIKI
jgi:peptide subunit release factor 1 (eRF1)